MQIQFAKISKPWMLGGIIAATIASGAIAYYGLSTLMPTKRSESFTQPTPQSVKQIMALGRLEPEGEVIQLAAPAALETDRVATLAVKPGDRVQAGQVIAILASRDRLERGLAEARKQIDVTQAELAQVGAGAKSGEIAAQQSEVTRLQAELNGATKQQQATIARLAAEASNANVELNRYQLLYQSGAISASQFDQRRLTARTTQAQLNEAKENQRRTMDTLQAQIRAAAATLNRIADVRPVDIQVAQSKVDQAIAAAARAEAELQQASIRSPIAGQILKVHTYPGEKIDSKGIVELGRTNRMIAIAEVYQTDIGKIRAGQTAMITSQAFPGELRGTVVQVGSQVSRQMVMSNQPGENLDRRIIEVNVRLMPEASQQVANLTNLQVEVAIQI